MGPPVTEAQSGPLPPPPASLQPELGQPSGLLPLSSSAVLLVKLVCRVLIAAMTFISLIVLATNTNFDAFFAYRYVMFVIVLAFVYSLLQTALSIFHLTSGNRVSNSFAFLDFYGDLVLVYTLATGAAAGFGITVDLDRIIRGLNIDKGDYIEKNNATSSLLFLSSVCAVVTLVLSR
ncbi:hypothetical protein QQ045_018438 [Rhodiola kirilowii]